MATIETRIADDGSKAYRVKIRLKGHPTEQATCARLTDAKRWVQITEAAIREGRHFKTSEAKRHTLGDLIDRYVKEVVPRHPQNAVNTIRHLNWWKTKLGNVMLSDIGPAQIVQYRTELSSEPSPNGTLRANATVLRYLCLLYSLRCV